MRIPDWLPEPQHPVGPAQRPRKPLIEPWLLRVERILHIETAGGIVLLACTFIAMILANSPFATDFNAFWQTRIGFTIGTFQLHKPFILWINDGLMTIFFFVVGLEIKRELVFGELRDPRKAALPAAAALGGMVVPAALYLLFQSGMPGERGWGIPMATDIAFVVGFLALLGRRVPLGLKILLLTLAIVDDIGAILVIAVAYTSQTSITFLVVGMASFGIVYILRWIGIRLVPVYLIVGAAIWFAFLKSGVHPTVAGVVLGLITPAEPWFIGKSLVNVAQGVIERLLDDDVSRETPRYKEAVRVLTTTARETVSPLDRLESALHPWVAFGIMPLFALANAGVKIEPSAVTDSIGWSVATALVVGKPLGIVLFSWLAVKVGLARLPDGVNWLVLTGAGCLAGIGFTMSLFIAGLALQEPALAAAKLGTLLGSAISAVFGLLLLWYFLGNSKPRDQLS